MEKSFNILIAVFSLASIFAQNPIDNYLSGMNSFTVIGSSQDGLINPRDLDFHPAEDRMNELWVLNQGAVAYNSNSSYSETVCVPENVDATFIIYDSYGDGICCSWGAGSYQVSGCDDYASGGNFGSSETTTFNMGSCDSPHCEANEIEISIYIMTDNYGYETSWELFNTNTSEMYAVKGEPGGSTVTYYDAGLLSQASEYRKDAFSNHFMNTASSIAFDNQGYFANTIECKDGNNDPNGYFAGPTLWDADTSVYARVNQNNNLLGSHLDMLHQSPYGMGIEYDGSGNVYWVFDGYHSAVVRYDFVNPHAYGGDNHSDGIVWRYGEVSVERVEGIPSHMVMDDDTRWLYIVDTGNQRVLRLNADSGQFSYNLTPYGEPLAQYWMMNNAEWEVYINTGLEKPSGIDIYEDRLIVSDYATGEVIIYDISADDPVELGRIDTGNEDDIMGVKIGPNQQIWYVNNQSIEVVRIDFNVLPGDVNADETVDILDIVLIVNSILGNIELDATQLNAANVNGDNIVNILDIILVVNMILGSGI